MLRRKLMIGAFNSCSELLPTEFGSVEVQTVNFRGEPIPEATVGLFRGRERFGLEKVGYGTYRLEVESPLYYFKPRAITVAQQRTVLRVVMSIGMACIDPFRPIRGMVEGMRKGEELWVKAAERSSFLACRQGSIWCWCCAGPMWRGRRWCGRLIRSMWFGLGSEPK